MKQAILTVSFGTSHDGTREKAIGAIEQEIATAFPEYAHRRAFTSGLVIGILKKRGIQVDNVEQALEKFLSEGIERLAVQPTHILPGEEYEKLTEVVGRYQNRFASVSIGAPLLSSIEDQRQIIAALTENYPLAEDQSLVLMGHGTEHIVNSVYAALDYMLKDIGHNRIFVGTVEAYPELDTVLKQVKKSGAKRVLLAPLMVVSGDHAVNDMASDEPDSWKSAFLKEGYQVECVLKGLGEYPSIRKMYIDHVKKALEAL